MLGHPLPFLHRCKKALVWRSSLMALQFDMAHQGEGTRGDIARRGDCGLGASCLGEEGPRGEEPRGDFSGSVCKFRALCTVSLMCLQLGPSLQ
jgi:hypothetical protein